MQTTMAGATTKGATDRKMMANAIRALAMDAVEKAKSGHPGMPMGMADAATVLWGDVLAFDPAQPDWPDRDRFVLSAGHGSMLLYALLHLTGFTQMTLEELKRFRQLGSRTAGHPEYSHATGIEFGHAPGVETTTGPLGQGLAMAVGMAIAEQMLSARFGAELVDHRTYVIAGDGCLMEGLSHEAGGLAGHLGLGKLIVLFDDNGISIDGPTSLSTSEDHKARFAAYGWHTAGVDGHDMAAVRAALDAAKADPRPSLIACKTIIGFGAPTKQGKESTHGAPLGAAEIEGARKALGWPYPPFEVPAEIRAGWEAAADRGKALRAEWEERLAAAPAELRQTFLRTQRGDLPDAYATAMRAYVNELVETKPTLASRKSGENTLKVLTKAVPELIGGSADLTHSNYTITPDTAPVRPHAFQGRYLHYGIREFGMAAAMNGIACHGGLIPYGGTFLVFSDYCRPAIRLSALMGVRVIYVMTHDSIGLGEDGPTHQPIEHLASLRAIPNLLVFRPADAVEVAECYELAMEHRTGPSVLALSRQNLPAQRTTACDENRCGRGAYVLAESSGQRAVTVFSTGSEVQIAMAAKALLDAEGLATAVVSVPSFELFAKQDAAYRAGVLGAGARVAIEAASPMGWSRFVEDEDEDVVAMRGFGLSAPIDDLYKHFGITAEAVAKLARQAVQRRRAA